MINGVATQDTNWHGTRSRPGSSTFRHLQRSGLMLLTRDPGLYRYLENGPTTITIHMFFNQRCEGGALY